MFTTLIVVLLYSLLNSKDAFATFEKVKSSNTKLFIIVMNKMMKQHKYVYIIPLPFHFKIQVSKSTVLFQIIQDLKVLGYHII